VALSAHVVIDDLQNWMPILARLQDMLRDKYGIEHATLQPEPGVHELRRAPRRGRN
jgi:cobalt-zinc-cadmium efflux system protein